MQKLKRQRIWLENLHGQAASLDAARLTMDAFEATRSQDKAMFLGRIWQHISNVEIRAEAVDADYEDGWAIEGEEVDGILYELHEQKLIMDIPKTRTEPEDFEDFDDMDEDEQTDAIGYEGELIQPALILARKAVLYTIYEAMPDATDH